MRRTGCRINLQNRRYHIMMSCQDSASDISHRHAQQTVSCSAVANQMLPNLEIIVLLFADKRKHENNENSISIVGFVLVCPVRNSQVKSIAPWFPRGNRFNINLGLTSIWYFWWTFARNIKVGRFQNFLDFENSMIQFSKITYKRMRANTSFGFVIISLFNRIPQLFTDYQQDLEKLNQDVFLFLFPLLP